MTARKPEDLIYRGTLFEVRREIVGTLRGGRIVMAMGDVARPRRRRSSNLAWGTRQENADDARTHGRIRAARRASAKLTKAQVAAIRREIGARPLRAIGERFGVSHSTIRGIATGRLWA